MCSDYLPCRCSNNPTDSTNCGLRHLSPRTQHLTIALFQQGEHPKFISARLGHLATGITMDLYTHMMPGMDEEAARRLDEDYKNASKKR